MGDEPGEVYEKWPIDRWFRLLIHRRAPPWGWAEAWEKAIGQWEADDCCVILGMISAGMARSSCLILELHLLGSRTALAAQKPWKILKNLQIVDTSLPRSVWSHVKKRVVEDVDPSSSTAKMGTNHLGIGFRVPQKNWLPHWKRHKMTTF